jgi:NAD(P)-dependent dehydrogenase (short-subunit alcohol dehydrogenase family)
LQSNSADLKAIDALFARLKEDFGALDILFANAGIAVDTPVASTTEEEFDRIFDVNVKGLFFTVQKALPLLRDGASIILNASIAPRVGRAGASLYSGSKAAVRAFARNFSAEFAPRGIRVKVVSPGPIETPIWDRLLRDPNAAAEIRRRITAGVPLGRMGRAEEVARTVVFLASEDSSFLLGTEIVVDGGVTELPAGAPDRRA